jgi:S1-C subfamily serine protease
MTTRTPRSRLFIVGCFLLITGGALIPGLRADVDKRVADAEAKRIAAVDKVRPTVVSIFGAGGQGGGSGVVISKDGYALTNFHVVEGAGNVMQCGMADGVLYDAVLVGLDRVGDVALIKLIPPQEGHEFPAATLGDSDKVKAGDWSLAMGNPFLLATDFQPTVTFGLVSGVHRYQYPAGTLLEYTDCIQVDTSINPGNSGGPLFNIDGELIGINGRGSFEKRGRVNSGVGYAISINQIKNFMGHLRAGLDTDHATLGAFVQTETTEDQGASGRLLVTSIIENSDVFRRGLDTGDEVVSFGGRPITSLNQYKNVLGIFPKEWRVPLVYRRENEKKEILVRLMKLQRTEQNPDAKKPRPRPGPPRPQPPKRKSPATAFFEEKPGFANHYFNKVERDRLWIAFKRHGDFAAVLGDWTIEGKSDKNIEVKLAIREEMDDKGPDGKPIARDGTYHLKPEMLFDLPAGADDESELRGAVRRAVTLMKNHSRSLPQEFWAAATDDELRASISEVQKDVATIQAKLLGALEEMKTVGAERAREPKSWQAHYDFALARLTAFCAYVHEYNYLLGQLRKEPPKRDPALHRGWRMTVEAELQSGSEAKRLAADAAKAWEQVIKDYAATPFAERAEVGRKIPLGLKWTPTGGTKTTVRLNLGAVRFDLDPLKLEQDITELKQPTGSGGLLAALYQYRRLLTLGAQGFEGRFEHGGFEPYYPPVPGASQPSSLSELRVDTEVLRTEHAAIPAKWYFSREDQVLLGFEVTVEEDQDPCEVFLYDYKPVDGRLLPHRMEVKHGNDRYMSIAVDRYELVKSK